MIKIASRIPVSSTQLYEHCDLSLTEGCHPSICHLDDKTRKYWNDRRKSAGMAKRLLGDTIIK
ncbi:hypothetical protein [Wolbachia endosymbiont of Tettigetta isshikii]|uniref:hypothetical protein n=1 Tax=Wolbachia endosymbiont of Tettigetta isshikii TaxID=3239093 RepID=UPI00397F3F26